METSKAYTDVNHFEPDKGGPPPVDAAGCKIALRGSEGKSLVDHECSQRQKGRVS